MQNRVRNRERNKQTEGRNTMAQAEQAEQAQTITLSKISSRGSEIPPKEIIQEFIFDLGVLFFGGPFRQRSPDFILPKIGSRGSESGERRPGGDLAKIPPAVGAPRKIIIIMPAAAARPENRSIPSIALPGARLRS